MNERLDNNIEELLRSILLKNISDNDYVHVKSKITNSWLDDDDYVIIFESMRPNSISYYIDKEDVEQEIRKIKIKKILKDVK